nr:MAG TPA: hypothetical protein [Caudoviricetes sp.]
MVKKVFPSPGYKKISIEGTSLLNLHWNKSQGASIRKSIRW